MTPILVRPDVVVPADEVRPDQNAEPVGGLAFGS